MPLHLLRFQHQQNTHWGIQQGDFVKPLNIPCTTTSELIQLGYSQIEKLSHETETSLNVSDVALLSPITRDGKVLCQGANYRQHMIDSGLDPDAQNYNMFFTKSTASIHHPVGEIVRPREVQLLDYEVELTLVLGQKTDRAENITNENLHQYVAGICIGNDVSARDIQIPQMQFHKGKSYRTFCPLGPVLCLLDKKDMQQLNQLQLTLKVNNEIRQQDHTANLVFKPAETLSEYSRIADFNPGDVLMTGTPSGCALGLPSPLLIRVAALLPEKKKWQLFIKKQLARPFYLQPGDVVESSIQSDDGQINLGVQHHQVISE